MEMQCRRYLDKYTTYWLYGIEVGEQGEFYSFVMKTQQ